MHPNFKSVTSISRRKPLRLGIFHKINPTSMVVLVVTAALLTPCVSAGPPAPLSRVGAKGCGNSGKQSYRENLDELCRSSGIQTFKGVRTILLNGIWAPGGQLRALQACLEAAGCGPVEVFTYDNTGRIGFEVLGRQLAKRVREVDGPVDLVGFSMGGLVIRSAMMEDPTLPLRRAGFMNTPHSGSALAFLPLKGVQQMRPGSAFMRKLSEQPWTARTLAVWCPGDLMVVPGSSARWDRADETVRSDVPMHIWPLFSGKIHRTVAEFLTKPLQSGSWMTLRNSRPIPIIPFPPDPSEIACATRLSGRLRDHHRKAA